MKRSTFEARVDRVLKQWRAHRVTEVNAPDGLLPDPNTAAPHVEGRHPTL
jgi:hypothetical protein